jgi:hypothetical protein
MRNEFFGPIHNRLFRVRVSQYPAARQAQERGLGTNHVGFRIVKDVE